MDSRVCRLCVRTVWVKSDRIHSLLLWSVMNGNKVCADNWRYTNSDLICKTTHNMILCYRYSYNSCSNIIYSWFFNHITIRGLHSPPKLVHLCVEANLYIDLWLSETSSYLWRSRALHICILSKVTNL